MKPNLLRAALLAVLSALVLALAACGSSDGGSSEGSDLGPDPAAMVPGDAPFYVDAVVRPEGSMADDLKSALSKLLATDDPGGKIREALDSALADDPTTGYTYTEDIEPWLGTRAGAFLTGYDMSTENVTGAAVIAVTDTDAAQAFIDKAAEADTATETDESYNGVDYKLDENGTAAGIDGDFLIAGTEQSFMDAVDAADGDSFADNSDANSALDAAPEGSLFSLYADAPAIVDLIKSSAALPPEQQQQLDDQLASYTTGPIAVWGTVTDSTFALGSSTPAQDGAGGASDLIASFPADSWLAFATADFGARLQDGIDQFEAGFQSAVTGTDPPPGIDTSAYDPIKLFEQETGIDLKTDLAWIGDAGGFVEGTSLLGIGAGLELEATDEDAASATLDKLKSALEGNSQIEIGPSTSGDGFKIQPVGAPVGADIALQDGKVVAAVGSASVDDVVSPAETLDGSDRFNGAKDALGDGLTPSFFLDFAPVISLIESTGQATSDPQYQAAEPYLTALDYLVAGSNVDGDRTTGSLVLGVKEGTSTAGTAPAAITPIAP